jgi:hypothetical protein
VSKPSPADTTDAPRLMAGVDLLRRTGADEFKIQYCEEDAPPVIWMASARWRGRWEVGAALSPRTAIFRLLDQVIDGGRCVHCKRPTGFEPTIDPMPLNTMVCWYQWDPERKTFRRGCA